VELGRPWEEVEAAFAVGVLLTLRWHATTTTVAAAQETGAVSLEPLDAGARPVATVAVPASLRIARARLPAGSAGLKARGRSLQRLLQSPLAVSATKFRLPGE
jgi:hypothetical protein